MPRPDLLALLVAATIAAPASAQGADRDPAFRRAILELRMGRQEDALRELRAGVAEGDRREPAEDAWKRRRLTARPVDMGDHPQALRDALRRSPESLESRDLFGHTLVHRAAAAGRVSFLHELARHGADLSTCDGQGWNALHHAAFHGHLHACRWLLEHGLDPTLRDSQGRSALTLAAVRMEPGAADRAARREIIDRLRARGLPLDILSATVLGDHRVVRRELAAGRQPTWQLAVRAIAFDHSAILVQFLDSGLPLTTIDSNRDSLQHEAARAGADNSLAALLIRGADVEARNEWGETPLHAAVRGRSTEAVQRLLGAGADREARNGDGRRPADLIARDRWPVLRSLLEDL